MKLGRRTLFAVPEPVSCTSVYLPARLGARGETLDPIRCTARARYDTDGQPRPHRGKHRTTLPGGARLRWTDDEAHQEIPA